MRDDLIARNPLRAVSPPRPPKREIPTLDENEARQLLDAVRGGRYEGVFALALGCGLRSGEIFGLRWDDIDLGAATVEVKSQLAVDLTFIEPKLASSRRKVHIPGFAVAALQRHRKRLGAHPHPERLLFTDSLGGPIRRSNFHRRHWKPLLERAGLPDLRFHDLRHTAATLPLRQGVHPKVVQATLSIRRSRSRAIRTATSPQHSATRRLRSSTRSSVDRHLDRQRHRASRAADPSPGIYSIRGSTFAQTSFWGDPCAHCRNRGAVEVVLDMVKHVPDDLRWRA